MTNSFDHAAAHSGRINSSASERPPQGANDGATPGKSEQDVVVIIHKSRLFRDCLKYSLGASTATPVADYSSIEAWLEQSDGADNAALILFGMDDTGKDAVDRDLGMILSRALGVPVIVACDSEDAGFIFDVLTKGVRGYVPTSMPLDVSIQVMQLVQAGGVFAPASSLLTSRRPPKSAEQVDFGLLTAKQLSVIDAIRKGKPNKTIAYELNMCESTVKVHVRNIMKKLQAKNRTQVAFIASKMLSDKV